MENNALSSLFAKTTVHCSPGSSMVSGKQTSKLCQNIKTQGQQTTSKTEQICQVLTFSKLVWYNVDLIGLKFLQAYL
jgi:hypothetical protein